MKAIDVEIFREFKCKADRCRHTCCKGWEIDIDDDTLSYYNSLDSEIGAEIRRSIRTGEEAACFRLTEDKRCPFLKDSGLCRIIEELGEDGLCDICRLHPRFFAEVNDYSLAGMGLSCERASELLMEKSDLRFILCDSGREIGFKELLEVLEIEIPDRDLILSSILPDCLAEDEIERMLDLYCHTEPIDDHWQEEVASVRKHYREYLHRIEADKYEVVYQYILFRQLERMKSTPVEKVIRFAAFSVIYIMLYAIYIHDDIEAVRRWSEQIEYSDENIDILLSDPVGFEE